MRVLPIIELSRGKDAVREKIYDAALNGRDPSYHRYHAELFRHTARKLLGKTPVGAGNGPDLRRLADTPNYWRMNDVLIFI